MRDLGGSPRTLAAAAATLEARADRANALHARLIAVRRLLLLGRLDEAASALATIDANGLPPLLTAVAEMAAAEIALRMLRTAPAGIALARAHDAAQRTGVPALLAEVAEARAALDRPRRGGCAAATRAAAAGRGGGAVASDTLVLDACRRGLRAGDTSLPLARRPILFVLARALAEAWPGDVDRDDLIAQRLPHAPARRDAPCAPARRDRPLARAGEAAGAHRGQPARLRARAARWAPGRRAGAADRRRPGLAAGAAGRRRRLVHLGACAGPRRKPAHRAARAGRAGGRRTRALDRPGARAALVGAAAGRIHDDLVTPRFAAARRRLAPRRRSQRAHRSRR